MLSNQLRNCLSLRMASDFGLENKEPGSLQWCVTLSASWRVRDDEGQPRQCSQLIPVPETNPGSCCVAPASLSAQSLFLWETALLFTTWSGDPRAPTFSAFCMCLTFSSRWKNTPNSPVTETKLSPAELSRTSHEHLDSTVLEINLHTPQMYDKIHPPCTPLYVD